VVRNPWGDIRVSEIFDPVRLHAILWLGSKKEGSKTPRARLVESKQRKRLKKRAEKDEAISIVFLKLKQSGESWPSKSTAPISEFELGAALV
jgi:hypothetical protein